MSTADAIIAQFEEFLVSLEELLGTRGAQEVLDLARDLGGKELAHDIAAALAAVLRELQVQLLAIRDTIATELQHAPALSGLIGLLQPLITGLECIVAVSAEQLQAAGLHQAVVVSDTVTDAIGTSSKALAVGSGILDLMPSPGELDNLNNSLSLLIEIVDDYVATTA